MLEIVSLKGFENRKVIAACPAVSSSVLPLRALLLTVRKVLLLDEPLGALDLRLRKDMQNELKRIQQANGHHFYICHPRSGGGALHVRHRRCHGQGHASSRSARPEDIYNEPKNAFVADFIGEI